MSNFDNGIQETDSFEKIYQRLRFRERRIYSIGQIVHLPDIDSSHVHAREWKLRKQSCQRLLGILRGKKPPLNILEVGCGNGWLSANLAQIEHTTITGIDINSAELEQAKSVFCRYKNIYFLKGDLHSIGPINSPYDIIVFAAALQYFRSVREILTESLSLLSPDGEIHILDTPFYQATEALQAAKRTQEYYISVGVREMIEHYFHHRIEDLKDFHHKIIYNPQSLLSKLNTTRNPFFHISISALK